MLGRNPCQSRRKSWCPCKDFWISLRPTGPIFGQQPWWGFILFSGRATCFRVILRNVSREMMLCVKVNTLCCMLSLQKPYNLMSVNCLSRSLLSQITSCVLSRPFVTLSLWALYFRAKRPCFLTIPRLVLYPSRIKDMSKIYVYCCRDWDSQKRNTQVTV